MKISKVEIFKVPFDNSYSNVIDILDYGGLEKTKSRIADTINLFYGATKKSYDGKSRAIKRVGNSTLLVLPLVYEQAREYNYMIIKDTNGNYYFYFITEVISENDNETNPSSLFNLEWDVWNNNIDKFVNVNNLIERKHYDRFDVDYGAYDDVIGLKPIFRNNNINIDLNTYFEKISYGERYIPAFYVITYKEMMTFPVPNEIDEIPNGLSFGLPFSVVTSSGLDPQAVLEDVTVCDSVNNRYNRKVVYQLAGIFDTETEEFINGFVEGANLDISVNSTPYRYNPIYNNVIYGLVNQPRLALDDKKTPYIDNVTLSFNSPFRYTYNEIDRTLTFIDNPVVLDIGYSGNLSSNDYIPYIIIGDIYIKRGDDKQLRFNASVTSKTFTMKRNDLLDYSSLLRNAQTFLNVDIDLIDPISYTPPFNSILIAFNSKYKNIFTPWYNDAFSLNIDLRTAQPQLEVKYNTEKTLIPDRYFIENSGFFSFGVDSLQNYMAKNGVQTKMKLVGDGMKMVGGIIQTIAGVKTGNSGMFSSGMKKTGESAANILKTNAQLMDAYRMPDEWSSNSGECDLIYQDRIRVIKEYVDRNSFVYREFMKCIYNEGYEFASVDSPFKNSRLDFDFVKTADCDLSPLKINANDREKLEQIFNRGVTKWHIWVKNGILKFSKNMIKDPTTIKNLEIITESNADLRSWLYN